MLDIRVRERDILKRIWRRVRAKKLAIIRYIWNGNIFKHVLGRFLVAGFKLNVFDYPIGKWPPSTPARKYIHDFLELHKGHIHGRCVEFPSSVYRDELIKIVAVTRYDIWGLNQGQGVTVVGDLHASPHLKDGSFDTFICTHVLGCLAKPWLAVNEMHRLLAPGGLVLCTVPVILQKIAPDPKDYWRFTYDSVEMLFAKFSKVEIQGFGNAATVAGSPFYLMACHFPKDVLNKHDCNCPSIIAVAAWK